MTTRRRLALGIAAAIMTAAVLTACSGGSGPPAPAPASPTPTATASGVSPADLSCANKLPGIDAPDFVSGNGGERVGLDCLQPGKWYALMVVYLQQPNTFIAASDLPIKGSEQFGAVTLLPFGNPGETDAQANLALVVCPTEGRTHGLTGSGPSADGHRSVSRQLLGDRHCDHVASKPVQVSTAA